MAAGPLPRPGLSARLPVHHLPRGDGGDDGLADRPGLRPLGDPQPHGHEDRPAHPQLWRAAASGQERHADHGRRADPDRHRRVDPAVVRLEQPLRLDRDAGDHGLWRHRLGGRLAQGGRQKPRGHGQSREVLLAVADRPVCRALPGLQRLRDQLPRRAAALHPLGQQRLLDRAAAQGRPADPVLQDHLDAAGRLGLRGPGLFRHRRHQQRGQLHRRPGRPGHHAGGDGGLGPRRVCLCDRLVGVLQIPAAALYPGRGRTADLLRGHGRRRPVLPVVQRPPGPGLHG
mmetsp:Transcript_18223/g.43732  ORF Transcript_18223/g.43732 Transcript_18223/m.43732 type:complete len:286 (-) Transcript_18223:372-1229(-)